MTQATAAKPQAQKKDALADYVTVAERIEQFYQLHPQGRIITQIVEHDAERGFILMRASVYRNADDAEPSATGHAYELKTEGYVQRTSYIEVCETSSVGRALAMLGLEVKRGIASREEMEKAERHAAPALRSPAAADERSEQSGRAKPAQPALANQLQWIESKTGDIAQACQNKYGFPVEHLSFEQASRWIQELKSQ